MFKFGINKGKLIQFCLKSNKMSIDVEFSSPRIKDQYLKVIDDKIEKYDDELNEVSNIDPEWYTPNMMTELLAFTKMNGNFLDTTESILFKTAEEFNTTIHLLTKDENGNFIPVYSLINPLEYSSIGSLKKEYNRIDPQLTFDEFLEGLIWESEVPSAVLSHFEKVIFKNSNYNKSDYQQEYWDIKIERWIEEDRQILQTIYSRQLDLLMVSIHPDIKRNYIRKAFETKNRELEFSVIDNAASMTSSVYDKFIFCNPTEQVPFIKISLFSDTQSEDVYKVYTRVSRSAINEWISKDEKLEEESPFQNEDYIFFLIKMGPSDSDGSSESLVSLNIPLYAECYLSETKLSIKVPSAYSTDVIQKLTQDIVRNLFNIDLFDLKERSVEIETIIDNFPHIELVYLQFYLASNPEASIYIKETNGEISSKTRKVRMYYKPLSESNIEDYMIEYETSNTKKILVKGPTEELSINFFVNIFGRTIKAFFLRQNAIKIMIHQVLLGEDFSVEKGEEKRSKKKKKSTTSDPHLLTKKGKIEFLKSIVELPPNYSSYCQCRRQPIILTDKEADAWVAAGETIFDKTNQKKIKKEVKTYVLEDGRRLNFTCPSTEYPDIHLTKESKDPLDKNKLYQLSPCCWDKKRKESVDPANIVLASSDSIAIQSTDSGSKRKEKIYNEANLGEDETKDPMFLPQELAQLLSFFSGEEGYNLLHPSKKVSTSTFLECILIALRESLTNIREYRNIIMDNTDPMVVAQEALGIEQTPENVHKELGNIAKVLDSKLHYRIFEEYFKINIFVFEIGNQDLKNPIIESDFELEIPYHKIFSARTLRRTRSSIILLKYRNSSEYSLIVDSKNRGKFTGDLTIKMMDLFLNMHEVSSQKPISGPAVSTIRNLFSRINWNTFFKTDPIQAQEIDISGKTRVVQLKSGMTIAIPPTQPFNVPLISKYKEIPSEEVRKIFGEPESWDDKGLWFPVMKIPNLMYVLTGYHDMPISGERNANSQRLPLNPFVPRIRQDIEFLKHRVMKRSVFALIQIIHWAWRLENRPNFRRWIQKYVSMISVPADIFEFTPESIHATFPKVSSVKEGFQEINRWWPEMFTPDGKIVLWAPLYQRILEFFDRESLIVEGSKIDPPQRRLLGFYDKPDDYPSIINVRIFITKDSFKNWSRVDRKREENPKLTIHTLDSQESISVLASKETPTRVLFKDHWITIFNIQEGDYETASKVAYHWAKNRKLTANYLSGIPSNYEIIVLSFSKKFEIIETDIINRIKDSGSSDIKRLYILRYPDDTYAAVLG